MYNENNLLMLSALQHLLFCPRQCALIHVEQLWVENRLTAEGRILHERVHNAGRECRRSVRIEFDMPIRSLELGLSGRADVVEFHLRKQGNWQPFPVEYKRGLPKKDFSDRIQLCAQALCLEEILSKKIDRGALYYGKQGKRTAVNFDEDLRLRTRNAAVDLHNLFHSNETPLPRYGKRCERCSFIHVCLPKVTGKANKVANYLRKMIKLSS